LNLKKNDEVSSVSCIQVLEGEDDPDGDDDGESTEVADSATAEGASEAAVTEVADGEAEAAEGDTEK
jgi:hypothetical protein